MYGNEASMSLFTKLGFVEVSRSDVFKEATTELAVSEDILAWLKEVPILEALYDVSEERQ